MFVSYFLDRARANELFFAVNPPTPLWRNGFLVSVKQENFPATQNKKIVPPQGGGV